MVIIDIAYAALKFSGRQRLLEEIPAYLAYFHAAQKRIPESMGIRADLHRDIIKSAKKNGLIEPETPTAKIIVLYKTTPLHPV